MQMTITTLAGRTVKLIEPDEGPCSASVCCPITLRPEWTVYGRTPAEALEAFWLEMWGEVLPKVSEQGGHERTDTKR